MIPQIDVSALYDGPSAERDAVDAAILAAADGPGFMTLTGAPGDAPSERTRRALLSIFALSDADKRALYRRRFAPENPNVYRGWFALQPGHPTYKEGIDIGPDLLRPDQADPSDPLIEPTPSPSERAAPGWRAAATGYYAAMERLGQEILRSIARSLSLGETRFDAAFTHGISTLRLIRYPVRDAASFAGREADYRLGDGRYMLGAPHVDSGFVTLLAQDGVPGLQAQGPDDAWITVPPIEGTLAVNFGRLLSEWTGGRIRATRHRVVGSGLERFSIPFFFEPAVDTVIAPFPELGGDDFEPFVYGDWMWRTTCQFVEFRGIEGLRPPRDAGTL